MKVESRITQLVEEKITDTDLFIISVRVLPKGLVVILVDGDAGVSIEACSAISRYVGFMLEEENLIEAAYTLEVSSPGIDYPLVYLRQYPKHKGRSLDITLLDNSKKEGKLTEVDLVTGDVTIEEIKKEKGRKQEVSTLEIPFTTIKESIVLVSFK